MRRGLRARLRRNALFVVIGGICVAALLVEIILLAAPANTAPPGATTFPGGPEVVVQDIELIPTYESSVDNNSRYLGQSDCGCAPINVTPGSSFSWWVRLSNSDRVNHTLVRVSINSPFSLLQSLPAPPIVLPAGMNVTLTMNIRAPTTGGVYILTGAIDTS